MSRTSSYRLRNVVWGLAATLSPLSAHAAVGAYDYAVGPTFWAFVLGILLSAGIVLLAVLVARRPRVRRVERPRVGNDARQVVRAAAGTGHMETVIASIGEAVITVDREALVTFMNYTAERLTGHSQQDALGKPLTEIFSLINEETREPAECPVEQVLHDGRVGHLKQYTSLVPANGSEHPIALTASPIRDEELKIVGVVVVFRDVTEGRDLRLQYRRYRMMVEQAAQGIAATEMDGTIVAVNAAMAEMHGYRPAELIGKPLKVLRAESQVGSQSGFFALVERNGYHTGEETHVRKDGTEFQAETKISQLKDRKGKAAGMVVLALDITERKQVQEDVEKARDLAEAANRSKSEFLANMSHEIRTPMNGIIGMTELTLDTQLTREQREYLQAVKSSADSLLTLLNDILDISKIEAGKLGLEPIEFDLRTSLGEILRTLAVKANEKGLELIYHVHPDVPNSLIGDAGRVRQIIVNLVGNAIKFTDDGEIAVHVKTEFQSGDDVRLHFSVQDTGMGVPTDKQNRIFGAFSQADTSHTRKFGGSGLGLAISAQLVKLMGGVVWVDSPSPVKGPVGGPGSTFHFTACFGVGRAHALQPSPLRDAQVDGLSMLVVDDNATSRRLMEDMLKNWGMTLRFADGGRAAMELLTETQRAGAKFDVVLLDAKMPGMDGFAVAERLKGPPRLAGATIMLLSSAGIRDEAARCNKVGASTYLLKPITQSQLHDAIVRVIGAAGQEIAPPLVTRQTARADLRNARVLLAEDNPVNQMLAVRTLEKQGFKVDVVGNGEKVLEALDAHPARYAAVLMDIQMPVMDGLEATAAIREKEQGTDGHVPIIALTAHAMKGDRERCIESGMDDYVAKPIRANEILAAIERSVAAPAAGAAPAPKPAPPAPPAPAARKADTPGDSTLVRVDILTRVDGDWDLLREVSGLYFDESPKLMRQIRENIAAAAAVDLAKSAHTLKGMLANLGAQSATEAALSLERTGKSGDLSAADACCETLEREVDRFTQALTALIEENPS